MRRSLPAALAGAILFLSGCGGSDSPRDPMVPMSVPEEERAYYESIARFVQALPPDPAEIQEAVEGYAAQYQSPEDKTYFLLALLQLQPPPEANPEDQVRLMSAWSSARRILAGQGAAALRPVVAALRRAGNGMPGIEDVLVEAGPAAGRVLADVLESPYPSGNDPRYAGETAARALMIHALGKIADEASRPTLEKILLADPEPTVRFAALQALVQMRDQRIVNVVCDRLVGPNEYWYVFCRHLLIEIYGIKPPYRDYGRDAGKWLAAFDNAYYKMSPPTRKLLECLGMPEPEDPKKGIPASLYARRILVEATGQDLGPERGPWDRHFAREDARLARVLIDALKDDNTINRDAIREGLIRLTRGLNFGTDPENWRKGLAEMRFFEKSEGAE